MYLPIQPESPNVNTCSTTYLKGPNNLLVSLSICCRFGFELNGLIRLLRFEPQPDSYDSILYDFQTAERPQWFIC